jgi:hypothetical protein
MSTFSVRRKFLGLPATSLDCRVEGPWLDSRTGHRSFYLITTFRYSCNSLWLSNEVRTTYLSENNIKILSSTMGFEPTTQGLLVQNLDYWATGPVPHTVCNLWNSLRTIHSTMNSNHRCKIFFTWTSHHSTYMLGICQAKVKLLRVLQRSHCNHV